MRSKTQLDVHEIHEWYKKFYKDFPSGVVQSEDFHRIYKEMFPDGDPTEYAKHAFRTYDTDGNGQVDFTEFMITLGVMSKGTTEEKLHYAFRLYDIDGNGVVTRDEASRVISVSPPPPEERDAGPVSGRWRATFSDGGPPSTRHRVKVSCLLAGQTQTSYSDA